MDILSIIGLVLALNAILVGAVLKGAGLMALVSAAAFMIVVVGTFAAIFIQTPLPVMQRALKIFPWIMRPPVRDGRLLIAKMVEWSNIARKQGLLGLETMIDREPDDFVQKALQLVVDGTEPDNISSVMYVDLNMREHADTTAAKVFEGMGIYSPTLGIIGAVLGLMAVLQNLADPSKLGHGIAAAFTATFTASDSPTCSSCPWPRNSRSSSRARRSSARWWSTACSVLRKGENPRAIESKLQGYSALMSSSP